MRQFNYTLDPVTGCWNWDGFIKPDGYGQISVKTNSTQSGVTTLRAHRFVYEEVKGRIQGGVTLDHLCRNRRCVNPAHLEPVSSAENTRRGASAKLDKLQATEIRLKYEAGRVSQLALAEEYEVSERTICLIVQGVSWSADMGEEITRKNFKQGRPTKLTDAQRESIRAEFAAGGIKQADLCRRYKVSPAMICGLVNDRYYTPVPVKEGVIQR